MFTLDGIEFDEFREWRPPFPELELQLNLVSDEWASAIESSRDLFRRCLWHPRLSRDRLRLLNHVALCRGCSGCRSIGESVQDIGADTVD